MSKHLSLNETWKSSEAAHLPVAKASTFEKLSDHEIWEKFREGDKSAFIHIYKTYFNNLYQYGSQFTSDAGLVEDAIQDLFIYLKEKARRLSGTTSIKFYLFKTLKRRILQYKEQQSRKLRAIQASEEETFKISFSTEQLLIHSQIEKERKERLPQALHRLTARQREAIYYFYYEDLSYAEMKELMNFSNLNAARNLVYRAINTLKNVLHYSFTFALTLIPG